MKKRKRERKRENKRKRGEEADRREKLTAEAETLT